MLGQQMNKNKLLSASGVASTGSATRLLINYVVTPDGLTCD